MTRPIAARHCVLEDARLRAIALVFVFALRPGAARAVLLVAIPISAAIAVLRNAAVLDDDAAVLRGDGHVQAVVPMVTLEAVAVDAT